MADFEHVIIYLRKSRSDDPATTVEEVLARHENILQEYAVREWGARIPEDRIYREVVSGETIKDRPVMQHVMKILETGLVSGVLVVEPQRLSRGDLQDCGHIINSLRYTNTAVITPPKTYDLSDEYDRKFFEMELTRGNDYLEYTKKILNRGRIASVKAGNFIGNSAPYGYRKICVGTGKEKYYTLEIVPEEAEAVRLMFDLYVNKDYGFRNIAHALDMAGYKPRRSAEWSPAAISCMIANETYIGRVVWNRRKTIKKWENDTIVRTRPRQSEYISVPGKHPAIISDELFYAAKAKRNRTPRIKRYVQLLNPLAGLLYCGTCGHAMSRKRTVDKKYGSVSVSFLCNNQSNCHTKSVMYDAVIDRVKETLRQSIEDFEVKVNNKDETDIAYHRAMIANLKSELKKLKEKDMRQKDAYEDGIYTKEEFVVRNAKLAEQISIAQMKLDDAESSTSQLVDYQERLVRFRECLEALDDDAISAADKNTLLKSCIDKIMYYNDSPSLPGIGRYVDNPFRLEIFLKL